MRRKLLIIFICILLLSSIFDGLSVIRSFAEVRVEKENTSESIIKSRSTIIVDCNGSGDYTNIRAAISKSKNGDSIRVWQGVYNEYMTINKGLTLIGNGTSNTIIKGNPNNNVILIKSAFVSISGFNITGATSTNKAGIKIEANFTSISNTSCYNNYHGIFSEAYNGSFYNNSCINNYFNSKTLGFCAS